MPYIKQDRRTAIEPDLKELISFLKKIGCERGDFNYVMTRMCQEYVNHHGLKYTTLSDVTGMLNDVKTEFERKVVAPYEDLKIKENGDIYGTLPTSKVEPSNKPPIPGIPEDFTGPIPFDINKVITRAGLKSVSDLTKCVGPGWFQLLVDMNRQLEEIDPYYWISGLYAGKEHKLCIETSFNQKSNLGDKYVKAKEVIETAVHKSGWICQHCGSMNDNLTRAGSQLYCCWKNGAEKAKMQDNEKNNQSS